MLSPDLSFTQPMIWIVRIFVNIGTEKIHIVGNTRVLTHIFIMCFAGIGYNKMPDIVRSKSQYEDKNIEVKWNLRYFFNTQTDLFTKKIETHHSKDTNEAAWDKPKLKIYGFPVCYKNRESYKRT